MTDISYYIGGRTGIAYGGYIDELMKNYDIVFSGTRLYKINQELDMTVSKPLGLINPMENKVIYLHHQILEGAAKIVVDQGFSGRLRILSYIDHGLKGLSPRHLIIIVKDNVDLLIEIDSVNNGSSVLKTFFLELVVGKGSRVRVVSVDNGSENSPSMYLFASRLLEDSVLRILDIVTPGLMDHRRFSIHLDRDYSKLLFRGIVVGRGDNRLDYITSPYHRGRYTGFKIFCNRSTLR